MLKGQKFSKMLNQRALSVASSSFSFSFSVCRDLKARLY